MPRLVCRSVLFFFFLPCHGYLSPGSQLRFATVEITTTAPTLECVTASCESSQISPLIVTRLQSAGHGRVTANVGPTPAGLVVDWHAATLAVVGHVCSVSLHARRRRGPLFSLASSRTLHGGRGGGGGLRTQPKCSKCRTGRARLRIPPLGSAKTVRRGLGCVSHPRKPLRCRRSKPKASPGPDFES